MLRDQTFAHKNSYRTVKADIWLGEKICSIFSEGMEIVYILIGVVVTWVYSLLKSHKVVHIR